MMDTTKKLCVCVCVEKRNKFSSTCKIINNKQNLNTTLYSNVIFKTFGSQCVCQCLLHVTKARLVSSRSYSIHDADCYYCIGRMPPKSVVCTYFSQSSLLIEYCVQHTIMT
jgi:hypothetical protein